MNLDNEQNSGEKDEVATPVAPLGQVERLVRWILHHILSFARFSIVFVPLWLVGAYFVEFKLRLTSTTNIMFFGWFIFVVSQKLAGKFDSYFGS